MTENEWPSLPLRRLADCWDFLRIPLNALERAERPGDVPYWGANSVQDHVNMALVNEEVVLIGEDGAPFFDRDRPVAFRVSEPIWPNNHIHILKPHAGVNATWLAYALNDVDYSLYVGGSTRDKLTQGALMGITLRVPSAAEQKEIADYLNRETAKIDALVVEQRGLVHALRERRAALIERAVTRGLHAGVEFAPSPIEWVPESPTHWGIGRLKYDTKMQAGGTPSTDDLSMWATSDEEGTPWVAIGDMSRRDRVEATKKSVTPAALAVNRLPVGEPGTLLLAMYASVGEVAHLSMRATWNQALLGITPVRGRFDSTYLGHVLRSMRQFMLRDVRSNTQANLNASQVGAFWLPRPPLAEQCDIAQYLDQQTQKIDALIAEAEGIVAVAKERRSALITAGVTGQIEVRGEVA